MKRLIYAMCVVFVLAGCGEQDVPLPTLAVLPSVTSTPSETAVPTETASPTATPTETETAIPSSTSTETATFTATWTATASSTPEPTATESAEDRVRAIFVDVIGRERADDIERLIVNERVVTLRYPLTDISAYLARRDAELNWPILVCELRAAGFSGHTYQFTGTIVVIDAGGNRSQAEGVEMILEPEGAARIDCEAARQYLVDLSRLAERWDVNRLLGE